MWRQKKEAKCTSFQNYIQKKITSLMRNGSIFSNWNEEQMRLFDKSSTK